MEKKKFSYKRQFAVVVVCTDEVQQQEVYEKLKKDGLTLKVVNV